MSKKTTEVGLANVTISQAVTVLDQEIAQLAELTERNYKTSGDTNLAGFSNVKEITDKEVLNSMFSVILSKFNAYNSSQGILKLNSVKEFRQGGFTYEEWLHDFLLRISIIDHKQRYDELVAERAGLYQFISEEEQKAEAMAKFLSKRTSLTLVS